MHRDAERDRLHLGHEWPRVLEPVGLREDDLRGGAALPERDEVALEPARLEVRAEGRDDERDVDVRGERLCGGRQAGRVPDDGTAAGENRADQAVAQSDPVPDPDVEPLVHLPPGQAGADGAALRPDVEGAAVDGRDASRHETGLQVFGELGIPAELMQVESRQRKAPSYEMGRRTRPFRRSVRR